MRRLQPLLLLAAVAHGGAPLADSQSIAVSPASVAAPAAASGGEALSARVATSKRLPPVAVLAFTGDGIAEKDLSAVTSRFETELLSTDSFQIVERRNIDKILREQGFQQSGACDNSGCSVEIGKLLSVQGIFTGEVAKIGKTWSLSVRRTDVGSGGTTFSHVLDIQGGLEDVLRGGCPEMALIASGRKKPENRHTVLVAKDNAVVWPWVVGGAAVAGLGAAAVVLLNSSSSGSNKTSGTIVELTW